MKPSLALLIVPGLHQLAAGRIGWGVAWLLVAAGAAAAGLWWVFAGVWMMAFANASLLAHRAQQRA